MIKDFWNWCNERHKIYLKRLAGDPPPWTKDPILQKYRFTNVFRDLDKGTLACRRILQLVYGEKRLELLNVLLYRIWNRLETAENMALPRYTWNSQEERFILDREAEMERAFTGAHMQIYTAGRWVETVEYAWKNWDDLLSRFNNLVEDTTMVLHELPYTGKFFAHQFAQDLRFTSILNHATDGASWALLGPGARRGIRAIGLPENLSGMRELANTWRQYSASWLPLLEIKDIQQSLCEFSKYLALKQGRRFRMRFYP